MSRIDFLAPDRLGLLLIIAGLAAVYVLLQRRRRHHAVRFSNLKLLSSLAPKRAGWRRHAAAAIAGLALAGLIGGLARPTLERRIPKNAATVMLVVDTSASMNATDVRPSRIDAATSAARAFIKGLPDHFRVGLVSFDRTARLLAPPTDDHVTVERAVDSLATGPGTATGEGIYTALDSIAAIMSDEDVTKPGDATAIVLLSDGVTTVGRPVRDAAEAAAGQQVPVTTIAFGTETATINVQGRFVPVPADPTSMAMVADVTGGSFFQAFTAGELRKIYDNIGSRVGYELVRNEVTGPVLTTGVVLLMLAFGAALMWAPRML